MVDNFDWLCHQVLSSLVVQRWSSTLATSACQSSRRAVALTTKTTSPWILYSAAACPSCPLELKLPWIPSRRPTSTTHLVTITTTRDKLRVTFDASVRLKPFTLSSSSCHLHLCEGVFSRFGRARLGVLLLPAEAEHHLPRLSSWQPCRHPGDAADHHGAGVCNVRPGGADPEIRHHQQDQPSRRWVTCRYQALITNRMWSSLWRWSILPS